MPVYVAKDYSGSVIGVVLAKNYELANAFWQGKGIIPHHVDSRTEDDLNNHPTGVLPIISTKEVHTHHFRAGTTIRVID